MWVSAVARFITVSIAKAWLVMSLRLLPIEVERYLYGNPFKYLHSVSFVGGQGVRTKCGTGRGVNVVWGYRLRERIPLEYEQKG